MYRILCIVVALIVRSEERQKPEEASASFIDVIDLSYHTTWRVMADYYGAMEKNWKICINCGVPGLGTSMHLEFTAPSGAMHPAVIPTEYLLTKLIVIDVSSLVRLDPTLILTLDVALQWLVLRHDPREPTLLLFKFGWKEDPDKKLRSCVCKIPGISYELAEWIAKNLTHVVGVATDAPTLESEQTRELTMRTVSNLLGKSGIYMIENVNLRKKIPEQGCIAIAMPLKLLNTNYVPTRLTAFCPARNIKKQVIIALKDVGEAIRQLPSRNHDVNLEEIMD